MELPKNCRSVKVRMRLPKNFLFHIPEWMEDKGQESAEARETRMSRHEAYPGVKVFDFDRGGVAVGSDIINSLGELGFVCLGASVERRTDVQKVDEVPEFNKRRVVQTKVGERNAVVGGLNLKIPEFNTTLEQDYTIVKFDFVREPALLTGDEVRKYFNQLANFGWGRIRVFENPVVVNGMTNGNASLSISFEMMAQKPKAENISREDDLGWGLRQIMRVYPIPSVSAKEPVHFEDGFPKNIPFSRRKVLEG